MKALTLFAGAGGADVGMAQAGIEHVLCVEWDEHAAATSRAAGFPCITGDVRRRWLYDPLPPIDLMWASPPCQDWSTAGKREGASGERNGWPWTWDVVDQLQNSGRGPRWLVAENVPGMLQHNGAECGKGCCADPDRCPRTYFLEVVMAEARERFAWADWRVLDAADYGVPQFRRRVILVAGPRHIEWPEPTHGEPSKQIGLFGSLRPWVTVRDALGLDGVLDPERGAGMAERHGDRRFPSTTEPSPSIRARSGGAAPFAFIRTEATGAKSSPDTAPAPTVSGAGNQYLHKKNPGVRKGAPPDMPAPTVCAGNGGKGCGQWSAGKEQRGEWEIASGRRRLTTAECARLQDFPGDYPWQGTKTSRYRQIGNAVPPTLARVVCESIIRSEA